MLVFVPTTLNFPFPGFHSFYSSMHLAFPLHVYCINSEQLFSQAVLTCLQRAGVTTGEGEKIRIKAAKEESDVGGGLITGKRAALDKKIESKKNEGTAGERNKC